MTPLNQHPSCPVCGRTTICACNTGVQAMQDPAGVRLVMEADFSETHGGVKTSHERSEQIQSRRDTLPRTHGSVRTPAHRFRYSPGRAPWGRPNFRALTEFAVMVMVGLAVVGIAALCFRVAVGGVNADYERQRSVTDEAIRRNVSR